MTRALLAALFAFLLAAPALANGSHDWCDAVERCGECWDAPWRFYPCKPGKLKPAQPDAKYAHVCVEDTSTGKCFGYRRTKKLSLEQAQFDVWRLQKLVCP